MSKPAPQPVEPPYDEADFRSAVIEGLAQADAGLGEPFDDTAVWLTKWGEDDRTPPC